MAESFIFYETFAKQLKLLDKELRYKFYEAIIEYGLYDTEPDFTGLEACAWLPIQEAISNAKARRIKNIENGKKGGNQSKTLPKSTPTEPEPTDSKPEPSAAEGEPKPTEPEPKGNLNVDVNGNVNGDDIIPPDCSGGENTPPTQSTSPPADALRLAELLYTLHKQLDPGFNKPAKHIHSWAEDIDKLHRRDYRSWEDIEAVIRWIKTAGNFWAANIISGSKLREQFPRVFLLMQKDRTTSPPIAGVDSDFDTEAMAAIFNGGRNA